MEKINNNNRGYTIRLTTYEGRQHMIVPVVMMREGVHSGSAGPVLHLASELGRFPGSWNGIPVTIHHPTLNGEGVSANLPQVLEAETVGRIFNTHMDGDRLKAEAWLDTQRLQRVSPAAYTNINQGQPLDVSVGVFSDNEEVSGVHNNEQYNAIARNPRPDHLALLPGEEGACNWQDGCGVRTNKKGGDDVETLSNPAINVIKFNGGEDLQLTDLPQLNNWIDADEEQKEKFSSYHLAQNSFSKNKETNGFLFPVVNPETGKLNKNALLQVLSTNSNTELTRGALLAVKLEAYKLLTENFDDTDETFDSYHEKHLIHNGFTLNLLGFKEIGRKLQSILDSMDGQNGIHYLDEIFQDYLVYKVRKDGAAKYYKDNYSISPSDNPVLSGNPSEVRKEIVYTPVTPSEFKRTKTNKNKEEKIMENGKSPCQLAKVEQLINNSATKFTENNKAWLLEQSEDTLDMLMPSVSEPQINAQEAIGAFKKQLSTTEDFMALMPEDMREQMKSGLALHKAERASITSRIIANTKEGTWAEEELKAMPMETLKKISSSIQEPVDYSLGAGATPAQPVQTNGEILLPAGVTLAE